MRTFKASAFVAILIINAFVLMIFMPFHRPSTAAPTIVNGDTNGDGIRDISDAVYLLTWLFLGGAEPKSCTADCCFSPDQVATLQKLLQYMSVVKPIEMEGKDTIRFEGVNVQIVNGFGSTPTVNGVGNLVVGYQERRTGDNYRSGSHNIIVGDQNDYSKFGGIVVGTLNTISGEYASVTGGTGGIAKGNWSSVSGGHYNRAEGAYSSATGGGGGIPEYGNRALGDYSAVTGGSNNEANGEASSVLGGRTNIAHGNAASVSGGAWNAANERHSSVGGGARVIINEEAVIGVGVLEIGQQ